MHALPLNRRSELASALTHGLGLLLAIAGLVLLVLAAAGLDSPRALVASVIYGTSLVLLYGCSTAYHALPAGTARRVLQVLDHIAILLLIAGTYTPFTLLTLRGAWGWSLFGVAWGLALVGLVLELCPWRHRRRLMVVLYLLMGWAVVVAALPLVRSLAPAGLWLLLAGGLSYSGGVVFYRMKTRAWAHPVWHLFVLGGSIPHFLAVWHFVLPPR